MYYIRLTFKCEAWNVLGCGRGVLGVLARYPEVFVSLPDHVKAFDKQIQNGMYIPTRSLFKSHVPNSYEYYHACGDVTPEVVVEALESFREHYQDYKNGLPAVALGCKPNENEIILNMKIALENAGLPEDKRKPFLSQNNKESRRDLLAMVYC